MEMIAKSGSKLGIWVKTYLKFESKTYRKIVENYNRIAKKMKKPQIDEGICIGCGVCALQCMTKGAQLIPRKQRVITPETTFERIILQSLEKGTLQNQIFDNPQSKTQAFMRVFTGAFLRLSPVKKALLSDTFRSSFLSIMNFGTKLQGKNWITEI